MNYVRVCGFHIIEKDIPTARLRRILKLEGVLMQISRSAGRLRMFNILRVTTVLDRYLTHPHSLTCSVCYTMCSSFQPIPVIKKHT